MRVENMYVYYLYGTEVKSWGDMYLLIKGLTVFLNGKLDG